MAIVVKEASNTPLAIAALAKNMADTYVNWNNSEREYAKWQQEQTWRNEDRQLGMDAANSLRELGSDAFIGGDAGMYGAIANARNNKEWSSYLKDDGSSSLAEWENKVNALSSMYQRQGYPPQQAYDRALIEITNPYDYRQSPTGVNGQWMSPGRIATDGDPVIGEVNITGDYEPNTQLGNAAMAGGNGAVAVGTPTPQAPTMTGDMVTHDGIKVTMKDIQDLAKETGATVDQIIATYGIRQQ